VLHTGQPYRRTTCCRRIRFRRTHSRCLWRGTIHLDEIVQTIIVWGLPRNIRVHVWRSHSWRNRLSPVHGDKILHTIIVSVRKIARTMIIYWRRHHSAQCLLNQGLLAEVVLLCCHAFLMCAHALLRVVQPFLHTPNGPIFHENQSPTLYQSEPSIAPKDPCILPIDPYQSTPTNRPLYSITTPLYLNF